MGQSRCLSITTLQINQINSLESLIPDLSTHTLVISTAGQLYLQNCFCSFQELCSSYPIPLSSFFKYLQIRHALRHIQLGKSDLADSTLDTFASPSKQHKELSPLYLLLSTPPQLDKPKQILTWQQSLSFSFTLKQWQQA